MGNSNDEHMVIVETYYDQYSANRAKSALLSNGIFCFLKDEYANQCFNRFAMGGIKLCILERDLSKAKKILSDL
ncbi:MAG: DUF2007 domain-containing protein [Paludibacteraceae bacterium]|nr:DUF2007 domain-containing protein [Paludibacteraceae bacterium]MBR4841457.1 DUF2007 domain-containing protein [Paludibacteraceae bacterium]